MVDWSIFWNNIFPGLIVLIASTISAYFLIHRYQRRKHKKEIRDDLLQLENDVVKSMLEFYNSYEDLHVQLKSGIKTKYDKEEEIRLGVEMNKAVISFETKIRLLTERLILQLRLKEEEMKSIRALRTYTDGFCSNFKTISENRKKSSIKDFKANFTSLFDSISMIILTARVRK